MPFAEFYYGNVLAFQLRCNNKVVSKQNLQQGQKVLRRQRHHKSGASRRVWHLSAPSASPSFPPSSILHRGMNKQRQPHALTPTPPNKQ